MTWMNVVFRALDRAGAVFIEPRREDGHGSSAANPTFVTSTESAAVQFYFEESETLHIPIKKIVYFDEAVTIDGVLKVDGIYKELEFTR